MHSSDSDDEDLKAAIALSLAEMQDATSTTGAVPLPSNAQQPGGVSGLNRKAMEAERLARTAVRPKRQRSVSPPPISRKAPKRDETRVSMSDGGRLESLSTAIHLNQQGRKSATANAAIGQMKNDLLSGQINGLSNSTRPESLPAGALKYPHGVMKKTWAFGHERNGTEIKLEEVLEPQSVRTAVLSAFQWDVEWVISKLKTPLNGGTTKCVFVMQAKESVDRDKWRDDADYMKHFLRLCFPSMSGVINCMHSKLMLLFHKNKLRIAVPSANLLDFDWGETGQMENSVFIIDLPRLPEGQKRDVEDMTPFGRELMFFIEKQGWDQDIRNGVLNFDFSATKDMAFVHTVGGVHYRDDAARTGLLGLSRAIQQLKINSDDLELDCAASSIGSLNDKQLQDIHSAAKGTDFVAQAKNAMMKAGTEFFSGKKISGTASSSNSVREKLRIYFPTKETVRASTAGAAGTICLQRRYFEGANFPRSCFRDYKSTREGLLSHNKIFCARGTRGKGKDIRHVAWLYHGSANVSKSAWGELPKERKENKIICRNWECGVLLPVPEGGLNLGVSGGKVSVHAEKVVDEFGDAETESEDEPEAASPNQEVVSMDVFESVVDLPFKFPGEQYNGREPWYFTE